MNTETRDGILYISGEVTVKTVTQAGYSRFEQQCSLNDIHTLDFSHVSRADSTCVSLLLTALRLKHNNVKFCEIPQSVRLLADLYEIKDWVQA